MRKLELILLSFFLFIAANVRAQCPDTVQLKIRLGQVFRVATGFKEVIAGLHSSADSLIQTIYEKFRITLASIPCIS